jgi:heme O synthase-like polyprenyltransferase
MSHIHASRSTDVVTGDCARDFVTITGFALTALGAISSMTMQAPSALAIGLIGFAMFVGANSMWVGPRGSGL